MYFKKAGGSIFGVSLNKAEQKALDQEIKRQIVENDHRFDMDKESMILWMLHTEFGCDVEAWYQEWRETDAQTLAK